MRRFRLVIGLPLIFASLIEIASEAVEPAASGPPFSAPTLLPSGVEWVQVKVELVEDSPAWTAIFTRPLPAKWFSRAVAESLRPLERPSAKPTGRLVFTSRDGEEISMPVLSDPSGGEGFVGVGSPPRAPSRDLACLLKVVEWQVRACAQSGDQVSRSVLSKTVERNPWSDREGPWESPWLARIFESEGCYGLAVEALEGRLGDYEVDLRRWVRRLECKVKAPDGTIFVDIREPDQARMGIADQFLQMAHCLTSLRRYDEALGWLERLAKLFEKDETPIQGVPCNIEVRMLAKDKAGEILEQKGDLEGASTAYRDEIEILEGLIDQAPHLKPRMERAKASLERTEGKLAQK